MWMIIALVVVLLAIVTWYYYSWVLDLVLGKGSASIGTPEQPGSAIPADQLLAKSFVFQRSGGIAGSVDTLVVDDDQFKFTADTGGKQKNREVR